MATNFDNPELFQWVAEQAIARYPHEGAACRLLAFSENATYLAYDPESGEKYFVLRVGRPGYHTLPEYESEISWLRQINDYTPLKVAAAPGIFRTLGETTAYLHRQTEIWNGAKDLVRPHWDVDAMIGPHAIWGDWHDYPELTPETVAPIERSCAIISRRLDRYGKTPQNYGIIHADLRDTNIIVEGDVIKVIDFDDFGFGWHLHDLASALTFIEDREDVPDLVNAWLDGYRAVLPFTDTDFVEIDTFILQRRIQMLAWLASHQDSTPVQGYMEGYLDGTMGLVERYLRLFG